jgi:hypothetical protein
VATHRLQRGLGGELGRPRELHQRAAAAQLAVLGQRAAGLAHEPDRHTLDRLAAQGA